MQLRKVGFFFEEPEIIRREHLLNVRNRESHPFEKKILEYLHSGVEAGVAMTIEQDILKTPPQAIGEAILKTDGEWIWPESLTYYVRQYHITLPDEFIEKMANEGWHVSPDIAPTFDIPKGEVEL